jgi:hypothetical protein
MENSGDDLTKRVAVTLTSFKNESIQPRSHFDRVGSGGRDRELCYSSSDTGDRVREIQV